MKRTLPTWCKEVKKSMIDDDINMTELAERVGMCRNYVWSYHEIVYKRRMGKTKNQKTKSKYSDSLIGWQKLPIRSQDTLYKWEYDQHDNLVGMTQMPPPDYRRRNSNRICLES